MKLTKTTLDLCDKCNCLTWTMMDDDGNRFCGKCKKVKLKCRKQELNETEKGQ